MADADPDPNDVFGGLHLPGFGPMARVLGVLKDHADPARGVENVFDRRAEFLVPMRAEHVEVQAATLDRYGDAFDALEFAILFCSSLEKSSRALDYHEDDWSREVAGERVLHDLFRVGTLVAGEALALMRAGYRTGALARWRALHETATRAEFISRAGGGEKVLETAQRYLDHTYYRLVRELQEAADLVRSIDPSRVPTRPYSAETAAFVDVLIAKHGKVFRYDYGWAHAHLMECRMTTKPRSTVADVGAGLSSATSNASCEAEPVTRTGGSFCTQVHTQQCMERPTHQSVLTRKERASG